jgi:hypothetical protein
MVKKHHMTCINIVCSTELPIYSVLEAASDLHLRVVLTVLSFRYCLFTRCFTAYSLVSAQDRAFLLCVTLKVYEEVSVDEL